jgi:hypothetical protein
MDLVMRWGEWTLLLENKVLSASITGNQLNRYYGYMLGALSRTSVGDSDPAKSDIPDGKRICVIYLTPSKGTGGSEYESLRLTRETDCKVHLSWGDLLEDIRASFPEGQSNDPYGRLIRDSCRLVEELVKRKEPKTPDTPNRIAMKDFIKMVAEKVRAMMRDLEPPKLTSWRDPQGDELYGYIGGDGGNVFLRIFDKGTEMADPKKVRLYARISFKIAGKALSRKKAGFLSLRPSDCQELLGTTNLRIDEDRCEAVCEDTWAGAMPYLADQIATLVCRYLLTFRPFMSTTAQS